MNDTTRDHLERIYSWLNAIYKQGAQIMTLLGELAKIEAEQAAMKAQIAAVDADVKAIPPAPPCPDYGPRLDAIEASLKLIIAAIGQPGEPTAIGGVDWQLPVDKPPGTP